MSRKIEDYIPPIKEDGIVTAKPITSSGSNTFSGANAFSGATTFSGATAGVRQSVAIVTGDTVLTTAQSGRMLVDNKGSATTTFTLPAATTAGLEFTFVCGDAAGEILVNPATGEKMVGKTHGAENGTGIANTTTGIKNTAATNVKGDFCTLVADGVDTWWMTAVAGVWASQ